MSKGIFVTGTGTDVGKTYVTALLAKKMREYGYDVGYYKAALSGANSIAESDAGYVNSIAQINQEESTLLSYLYHEEVSPHLAAKWENHPVEMEVVKKGYETVCNRYPYVMVEGSGGIICPIRYDKTQKIFLEDIIKMLELPSVIIAHAGLGTINATVLTVEYMRARNIEIKGIILNFYTGSEMEQDNITMIEEMTNIPVLSTLKQGMTDLEISKEQIATLWGNEQ